MIIHSETERIPVFHSRLIANALLLKNSTEDIDFHLVEEYEHKKMPLFLKVCLRCLTVSGDQSS